MTSSRRNRTRVLAVSLAFGVLTTAPAAQRPPERVLTDYQTVKLAEGVYAFVAPESKTPFVSGNSLAVIGSDGVLVVDSTNVPSLARRMIGDIKKLTDKPVRVLVNTHWHPDHLMGNAVYQEAFPGISVVSTTAMREIADAQVPAYFEQTLGAAGKTTTDTLRTILKSGKNQTERTSGSRIANSTSWSLPTTNCGRLKRRARGMSRRPSHSIAR